MTKAQAGCSSKPCSASLAACTTWGKDSKSDLGSQNQHDANHNQNDWQKCSKNGEWREQYPQEPGKDTERNKQQDSKNSCKQKG